MAESAEVIASFADEARAAGASEVYAFATEAIRAAKNAHAFIKAVKEKSGLTLDVIDGVTESKIGTYGALADFGTRAYVIDIGGGSTELARFNGEVKAALSLPLGTHNLRRIAENVDTLSALLPELLPAYREVKGDEAPIAVAIGGTPGSIAAITLGLKQYEPESVHGCVVTVEQIERALPLIRDTSALLSRFPFIGKRAEVLPYGAVMLLSLLNYLDLSEVTCSEKDGMEGYLARIDGLI